MNSPRANLPHLRSTSWSRGLRWAGLAGILTIAAVRCVIVFAPQIAFDTDPAFDDAALLAVAPAGNMMLNVLMLVACAMALLGEWAAARTISWPILVLALLPLPSVLVHGWHDAGNLWMGSTMLAAAVACAALAHLARDPHMRAVVVGVLLATTIPVMARGVVQVAHEHPQTVQFYEEHKEQFLRDRGWTPESSAARIYERRLKQPQPIGWFATSNVLASLATFALVLSVGLAIGAVKARMQSGWSGSMVLVAALSAALLWLSGSKGAAMASVAGLVMLVFFVTFNHRTKVVRCAGLAAIALIVLAIFGVVIRGALMPESFAGDRSLLFRWHYWIAAARMLMDHPLLGVGPDGFQAAYILHRVPRNPEEVVSSHCMFIDWVTMLGVLGAGWIALVGTVLFRNPEQVHHGDDGTQDAAVRHVSGSTRERQLTSAAAPGSLGHVAVVMPAVVLALGIAPAHVWQWAAIDGVGLVGRLLGAAAFFFVAVLGSHLAFDASGRIVHVALVSAIAALVMHGQIEMTFVQPGAMMWAMCAIGSLGLPAKANSPTRSFAFPIWIMLISVLILSSFIRGILPAYQQQSKTLQAASLLWPIASDRENHELMLRQRRAAAAELVKAYEAWPSNVHPLNAAATQLQLACSQPTGPQPLGLLLDASEPIERALREHDKSSSYVIAIDIYAQLAAQTGDADHWQRAIELAQQLANRDPHGISSWRRMGDVLWAAGEQRAATDAYRRALQNDANFELDPDKQLLPAQRDAITRRIKEIESS